MARTVKAVKARSAGRSRGSASGIDAYLATLDEEQRGALEKLRQIIRLAAPGAEECISYALPAFRLDGRVLVAFGASPGHCAFYPMSPSVLDAHRPSLDGFKTSKGTIRFSSEKPLPARIVKDLVRARIAETRR